MVQQAFEVSTPAGVIRGMAYLADVGGRRPTVMMCHGFTGNRIESGFLFVRLGRALAEAGLHAVAFDFVNSGESDGSFEKMRVSEEIRDAGAVAHWLEGQPFVDRSRLGGLGFSLGGLVVSGAHRRRGGFAALGLLAPTTAENLQRVAGDTGGERAGDGRGVRAAAGVFRGPGGVRHDGGRGVAGGADAAGAGHGRSGGAGGGVEAVRRRDRVGGGRRCGGSWWRGRIHVSTSRRISGGWWRRWRRFSAKSWATERDARRSAVYPVASTDPYLPHPAIRNADHGQPRRPPLSLLSRMAQARRRHRHRRHQPDRRG